MFDEMGVSSLRSVSGSAVVACARGDRVWLRCRGHSTVVVEEFAKSAHNVFTGFLIRHKD